MECPRGRERLPNLVVFASITTFSVVGVLGGAQPLLSEGRYFVWFKTPIGEGASEVELLPNGDLTGADTNLLHRSLGSAWRQI